MPWHRRWDVDQVRVLQYPLKRGRMNLSARLDFENQPIEWIQKT
jgi:hypothetical protein